MPSSKSPRSSRRAVPASARLMPVTREMLDGVRGELVERIAGAESRLNGEITRVESKLTGEIARVESKLTGEISRVESKLTGEISRVENKLTGEIARVESKLAHVAGDVHDLKASVSRLGVLIEEQNERNSIVFEALHGVIEQQKRFDERLDRVENTVRSIASGRRRP